MGLARKESAHPSSVIERSTAEIVVMFTLSGIHLMAIGVSLICLSPSLPRACGKIDRD
jgi:hypothetical protein